MKTPLVPKYPATALALLLGCATIMAPSPSGADPTGLADIPLVNTTTVTVLPNLMFVLDNSGSMNYEYMPDNANSYGTYSNTEKYWKSKHCNSIYYDPAQTYDPPIKSDGSLYDASTFGYAWTNGFTSSGSTNLKNAYYYRYTGSQKDVDFTYTATGSLDTSTTFYKECKSSVGSNPGASVFTKVMITSTAEKQNFANWYSYYRTRLYMTKTSLGYAFFNVRGTPVSPALDPSDADHFHARIGFTTISDKNASDGSGFLHIDTFEGSHRDKWYATLYKASGNSNTPLRGSLSKVGRIYAGKLGTDPIQYSCQRNYVILSSDGYWNTGTETSTYTATKENGSTLVKDQDGIVNTDSATKLYNPVPSVALPNPSYDAKASATNDKKGSLADIAFYYYHTDLRSDWDDNVPPATSDTTSLVADVATWQHMTTFTVGLGVSGVVTIDKDYKNETSTSTPHDYYDISVGTTAWPEAVASSGGNAITNADDLWHAAVNGRGTYFSATNRSSLEAGLKSALGEISSAIGHGAAPGTDSLYSPAGGFAASYKTLEWSGDVKWYNAATGGPLSGTVKWSATEKLQDKFVATDLDDTSARKIYTGSTALVDFEFANLSTVEQSYLDNSLLSQYATWTAAQKTAATGAKMVAFLRGAHNATSTDNTDTVALYRARPATGVATPSGTKNFAFSLGDVVHSQPIYVPEPVYSYKDTDYKTYADGAAKSRTPMLYVGGNDGMLHAFKASNGEEVWAYVPPIILPNIYKLADANYKEKHVFYIDGTIAVADAYFDNAWHTVLLSGLGKGGRGYFAIDITVPESPKLLWNYTAANNADLGYSYGIPLVTKQKDGTWVAVLTSGYYNVAEGGKYSGDGKGHVFVLDLATGKLLRTYNTDTGSTATPSGLSRINIQAAASDDNSALGAYGGDLLGNMWRFDINAVDGTNADKLAELGTSQPITAMPEIGFSKGTTQPVILFGTGSYLGTGDLGTDDPQSFYAIRDSTALDTAPEVVKPPFTSPKLVEQVLSGTASPQSITASTVDWTSDYGWYVKLPTKGERVAIDPVYFVGYVAFSSIIPLASGASDDIAACKPNGEGWLYAVDVSTAKALDGGSANVGYKISSPAAGFVVTEKEGPEGAGSGNFQIDAAGMDGSLTHIEPPPPESSSKLGAGTRTLWRELVN